MRFAAKDHLGESNPLCQALLEAGHTMSQDGPNDLFLIDLDTDMFGYRELIDFYVDCGGVILQYPHGAPASTLQYDCLYDPYEKVDGQLTNGEGEIAFLRSLGIERPAKPMGWQLCRQFEFRATDKPRRVVFAPTHVNADGTLDYDRVRANSRIFKELLEGGWELEVRYIGDLKQCGLWEDERVFRYVAGDRDMTTVEIDAADCVVGGAGTYPSMAIARGVPTIMYGQFAAALYGLPNEKPKPLRNVEKYHAIVRYPLDEADGSLDELIPYACASEEPIAAWRDAWIGKPFDGSAFVAMVEDWIPELRERRAALSPVG
jgi:hypothetical protein